VWPRWRRSRRRHRSGEAPRIGGLLRSVELRQRKIEPATEGAAGRPDSSRLLGPRNRARTRGQLLAQVACPKAAQLLCSSPAEGGAGRRVPPQTQMARHSASMQLAGLPLAPQPALPFLNLVEGRRWPRSRLYASTLPESCGEH
jgi:hypothetical protein